MKALVKIHLILKFAWYYRGDIYICNVYMICIVYIHIYTHVFIYVDIRDIACGLILIHSQKDYSFLIIKRFLSPFRWQLQFYRISSNSINHQVSLVAPAEGQGDHGDHQARATIPTYPFQTEWQGPPLTPCKYLLQKQTQDTFCKYLLPKQTQTLIFHRTLIICNSLPLKSQLLKAWIACLNSIQFRLLSPVNLSP